MNSKWLIGAALALSLSAVACGGDDDKDNTTNDAGHNDAGQTTPHQDGGIDGGSNIDSGVKDGGESDAGDAG